MARLCCEYCGAVPDATAPPWIVIRLRDQKRPMPFCSWRCVCEYARNHR